MKNKFRILALLMALLMCIGAFASCTIPVTSSDDDDDEDDDKDVTTTVDPIITTDPGDDPVVPKLTLVENGASQYVVVYAKSGSSWEKTFAKRVANLLKDATGVEISVVKDADVAYVEGAKEIIIGTEKNNRSTLYTPDATYSLGYEMYAKGNSLIIEAGSKTGAYFALYQLAKDLFNVDIQADKEAALDLGATTAAIVADYSKTLTLVSSAFPYIGIAAENFRIVHDGEYVNMCLAYSLQSTLRSWAGETLDIGKISDGYKEGRGYFILNQDDNYENGDWEISASGNKITISAGCYLGFEAAISEITEYRHDDGYMLFGNDANSSGNFIDSISPLKKQDHSTKYVYDRKGEYRVMFYNALFGNSTGGRLDSSDKAWNDVPANDRNKLQGAMFAEYMPDVLGLQEMDRTKRGFNSTGDGGLIALLADLGYVEAVDPRVKNLYAGSADIRTEEEAIAAGIEYELIPGTDSGATDGLYESDEIDSAQISGTPILGYGTGSGTQVTVDGETFYTAFNHTPLLYNTETTKLIHAEYYWYKYQWDLRKHEDCELCQNNEKHDYLTTMHHPNSAGDAASKSATWGIFESIETGEVYIVISTHMCTRSDYVRGLQADEIFALIEQIRKDYPQYADAPLFFGGDMNGNETRDSANYKKFTAEDSIFKSLQDYSDPTTGAKIATEFTSESVSSHGYPLYDTNNYIMTPGNASVGTSDGDSIDQIFVDNEEKTNIYVYGVIADFCALRGSDHLPLMVDFSIK